MPRLNTYPTQSTVNPASKVLAIVPGVGSAFDTTLIDVADIGNGADGDEVEMRTNSTHVQWKLLSASVWNNLIPLVDLKGTAGSAGAAGAKWYTGTDVPAAGTGANGDFYLRSNGDYYGPKASGVWGAVVASLKGAPGSGGGGGGVISAAYSIDNNAVKTFNVASGAAGLIMVYHESLGATPTSMFAFYAGATSQLYPIIQGSIGGVVGSITGTTGDTGSINVGIANGQIMVNNRLGWTTEIKVFISVPEA